MHDDAISWARASALLTCTMLACPVSEHCAQADGRACMDMIQLLAHPLKQASQPACEPLKIHLTAVTFVTSSKLCKKMLRPAWIARAARISSMVDGGTPQAMSVVRVPDLSFQGSNARLQRLHQGAAGSCPLLPHRLYLCALHSRPLLSAARVQCLPPHVLAHNSRSSTRREKRNDKGQSCDAAKGLQQFARHVKHLLS